MKINDLTFQVGKLNKTDQQQAKEVSTPVVNKQKNEDSIEISIQAKKVEHFVEKAAKSLEEDSNRLEAIKQRIAAGTYDMDSKKLASKMLSDE